MLKQEAYEKVSEVFGTMVGVASMVKVMDLEETNEGENPIEYKKFSDEIDINMIILNSIDAGKYKDLQRSIYLLNKNRHPRTKELTIYKKAWNNIK